MSTIVIIGILDITIITLLSSGIVSPIHVVDVFFWSPLQPLSFHQGDNAESQCQQEQNEENTCNRSSNMWYDICGKNVKIADACKDYLQQTHQPQEGYPCHSGS